MEKVVIATGGRGTRVHELTGGVIPKSLCRISDKAPKSLISYQLEQIVQAGIDKAFLIFEHSWQIQLFNQLLRIKEVPELRYSSTCIQWGHPLSAFGDKRLVDFIGDDDFVLTYGDLFYSKDLLEGMRTLSRRNNTSVASLMYSRSDRWKDGGKKVTFSKDENNRVVDVELTQEGGFTMHAPFFFQNRALESILEEVALTSRTIPLLKRLITKNQLSVFHPQFLLNMNTPEDIPIMENAILEHAF